MTYYKIIAGNGRTYITNDNIDKYLDRVGTEWIRIRTTENQTVFINLRNIACIEAMDKFMKEPSEIEQIVGATLNGLFGKPKQIETIDLGEKVE